MLKTDNKKFIVYKPAILLANKRSYLATKPSLVPRGVAFDLGIKRLLCDDRKDDESFWGRDRILVNTTTGFRT